MHDRRDERAELKRLITTGISLQMFAPRRVGKTWLLRELAKDLKSDGWNVVFVDVQGKRTIADFLKELCDQARKQLPIVGQAWTQFTTRLDTLFKKGLEGNAWSAFGALDFAEFSESLVAALNAAGARTVIIIDEIAYFVSALLGTAPTEAKSFLYHLRRLQLEYRNVRWILTGSIGIDVVAKRANLQGALVDLDVFTLDPFTEVQARSFLEDLNHRRVPKRPFAIGDEAFAHLARQLGWLSPYYVEQVVKLVDASGPTGHGLPLASVEDIERAFEAIVRPEYRKQFSPFEEYIDKNFPTIEARRLHAILRACSRSADGEGLSSLMGLFTGDLAADKSQLMDALTALEAGGHLVHEDERWRFRSGLLRRYWLKYHPE